MYMGLGDDSVTDLSGVETAITGAATPCEAPYVLSSALDVCVLPSSCPTGYSFTAATGVCTKTNAFTAWLTTGNNAIYAGSAVVAFVFVLMLAGGRR
jgi:hypothetical protein